MSSAHAGFGPPPLGNDTARFTKPLANYFGIVVSADVDRCGCQRFVLPMLRFTKR